LAGPIVAEASASDVDGSTLAVAEGVDDESEDVGDAVAELVGAGPVEECSQNGAAIAITTTAATATAAAPRTRRSPAHRQNRDPDWVRAPATARSTRATARPESAGVNDA
jgi:hypothetical protein